MPARARGLKCRFCWRSVCVPARRTSRKTASPAPCTCVGEPLKASTAGKMLASFKDTSKSIAFCEPRRGCSGREATWGNDTASRRHSIRRFQRVERKTVAAVVRRARTGALQRRRCKCPQARPRPALRELWLGSNAASPPATLGGRRRRSQRTRRRDVRSSPRTKHHTHLHTGSPASSK